MTVDSVLDSLLRSRSQPEVRAGLTGLADLGRSAKEKALSERAIQHASFSAHPVAAAAGRAPGGQGHAAADKSAYTAIHMDDAEDEAAVPGAHSASSLTSMPGLKSWCGRWVRHHDDEAKARAIDKTGACNVTPVNNVDRNRRFMQDLFNTLVDCRWRYTLLAFVLGYLVSWMVFALIWYLIAAAHGDLGRGTPAPGDTGPPPCVVNINDFTGCFLYSVESQMTIGYGTSYPSQECPEAMFVLCMQSILGLIIQAFTVGMVFAKLTRPKRRSQTLVFSRRAVVNLRDGRLCLQFRVADIRKTHMVDARLRAHLLHTRRTAEGERLDTHRTELKLTVDSVHGKLFLIWPLTAVHRLDHNSPLYYHSAQDLLRSKYEILVFLEGTIESTGQVVQARSSFLPSEVLWGHRFEPVVRYDRFLQSYEVDHSRLHQTVQVDAPLCSAHELDLLFHDPSYLGVDYGLGAAGAYQHYGCYDFPAAYPDGPNGPNGNNAPADDHDRHRHVEHMYMAAAV